MHDYQIAAGCRDHHSAGVRRDATPHQAGHVEHFAMHEALLRVRIDVPRVDAAIEAGRQQQSVGAGVFNVFHPVHVAAQAAHFFRQVARVPQRDRRIVRTGGEHTIVEESGKSIYRYCCTIRVVCVRWTVRSDGLLDAIDAVLMR